MHIPSRKERKAMVKAMGLKKKKESFKEMMERFKRSQEFGKVLHMMHLQNIENQQNPKLEETDSLKEQETWEQLELKKTISDQDQE
jgi:hypothetical protein